MLGQRPPRTRRHTTATVHETIVEDAGSHYQRSLWFQTGDVNEAADRSCPNFRNVSTAYSTGGRSFSSDIGISSSGGLQPLKPGAETVLQTNSCRVRAYQFPTSLYLTGAGFFPSGKLIGI